VISGYKKVLQNVAGLFSMESLPYASKPAPACALAAPGTAVASTVCGLDGSRNCVLSPFKARS
jgi:hypothetical protein